MSSTCEVISQRRVITSHCLLVQVLRSLCYCASRYKPSAWLHFWRDTCTCCETVCIALHIQFLQKVVPAIGLPSSGIKGLARLCPFAVAMLISLLLLLQDKSCTFLSLSTRSLLLYTPFTDHTYHSSLITKPIPIAA